MLKLNDVSYNIVIKMLALIVSLLTGRIGPVPGPSTVDREVFGSNPTLVVCICTACFLAQ